LGLYLYRDKSIYELGLSPFSTKLKLVVVKLSGTHFKLQKVIFQKENIVQSKQFLCQRVEKVQYVIVPPKRNLFKKRLGGANSKIRFFSDLTAKKSKKLGKVKTVESFSYVQESFRILS
jgi:hypothetical protein